MDTSVFSLSVLFCLFGGTFTDSGESFSCEEAINELKVFIANQTGQMLRSFEALRVTTERLEERLENQEDWKSKYLEERNKTNELRKQLNSTQVLDESSSSSCTSHYNCTKINQMCNITSRECVCVDDATFDPVGRRCVIIPRGFAPTGFPSVYLRFQKYTLATWQQARNSCREYSNDWGSSDLVVIQSEMKQREVFDLTKNSSPWIGLRQTGHYTYEWVDGSQVRVEKGRLKTEGENGYQEWSRPEDIDEDRYDQDDCIRMGWERRPWKDDYCEAECTYVCEFILHNAGQQNL